MVAVKCVGFVGGGVVVEVVEWWRDVVGEELVDC